MAINNSPIVFYHGHCMDGMMAAMAFYSVFKSAYTYKAINYGDSIEDVDDRVVYFVDYCPTREQLLNILSVAKLVTVIDHHKTAIENIQDIKDHKLRKYLTTEQSGAMLAWRFVRETFIETKRFSVIPEIVYYIEDRDLWKFAYSSTKNITLAVSAYDFTFEAYSKLLKRSPSSLEREGEIINRKYQKDLKSIVDQCKRLVKIQNYEVPIASANGMFASDLGNILSVDYPFAATYYDTNISRVFSLRSQVGKGEDVSLIAKKYGGGGHKHAAGFKVPRDHELAKL